MSRWALSCDLWNRELFNIDVENKDYVLKNYVCVTRNSVENTRESKRVVLEYEDMIPIITNDNFSSMKDIDILENMTKTASWLINNHKRLGDDTSTEFLGVLKWQILAIEYFMSELRIRKNNIKISTELYRSSYKSCPQKDSCMYQYPDDIDAKAHCKFQHYPYANLHMDCMSIYNYVKLYFNDGKNDKMADKMMKATIVRTGEYNPKELFKSLKTVYFIIDMMYKELNSIIKYRSHNSRFNVRNYHKFNYHRQNYTQ